ncbi:MAG: ferredoxin [Acidimicrobiales bacterium]
MKRVSRANVASQLVLDGTKCDGHGICTMRCPELISLDDWGYAVISDDVIVERVDIARARRAVRSCPEGALELREIKVAPKVRQ